MKILFLAANPVDVVTRLRVDEEIREIGQKIRLGPLRDQVELVSEFAVRAGDLQEALLRHRPDVVHFSGHCNPSGGIILEDEAGNRKVVSKEALADLFRILKDNVRVVVLNACHGKEQALALAKVIDFTIGMKTAIEDRAAIVFAGHFYQSLTFGRSVEESFELAVNQLSLEGLDAGHLPELLVRDGGSGSRSRIDNRSIRLAAAPEGLKSAFSLSWLFTGIALSVTTDLLHRFLNEGWPDIAAAFVQSLLIGLSTIAVALAVTSLVWPVNHFVKRPATFKGSRGVQCYEPVILGAIAPIIALGIWLSLPMVARYYNERGIQFQADLSRARESYQQAVRLKPNHAQAHYDLATEQEDLPSEMEEYLLAIKYDSYIYAAYNNLARLYLRSGDYENALNILSRAAALSPQDDTLSYSLNKILGLTNCAPKHYRLTEIYLRRAISLRGEQGDAAARCLLAYVLKEQCKAGGKTERIAP